MPLDRRLFRLTHSAPAALALTVGAGWVAGIVLVGQAWLLSRVVAGVFLRGQGLGDVQSSLALLLALALARAGLTWGGQVAAQRVAGRVKTDLRDQLSAHLVALGPAYTRRERSGELSNTFTAGVEALDAYFGQYLPQLALAALVPLTILIFVLPLDTLSGLVLLLTAPLIPLFMVLIGDVAASLTRRQWTQLSRMSAHFLDVLQGLTTLKLLGRSREQAETIARVSQRFRERTMAVLRVSFLSALVLELVATLSTAVVAVEIGLRLLYGRLSFEQAFFVLILAPEFYLPLRLLGSRFHAGTAGRAAAARIFQILDTPAPHRTAGRALPAGAAFHVRFDGVAYTYEAARLHNSASLTDAGDPDDSPDAGSSPAGGTRAALNNVSFEIRPGQTVALVGPSGGGKSTVAQLLLRFIEPGQGTITVNGVPLTELDRAGWRQRVAWVPQQPYLFHASVAENIRLARPEASPEAVVAAARQAHADAFIRALPRGYDTPVGERGLRLSGGQAQRIALARAFLKDAPLLILDEPTAQLDPGHQALLQESIARLVQGRTTLLIAHRLSTVFDADRIVVLRAGRVVEAGSHRALLARDGLYRQLVSAYRSRLPALGAYGASSHNRPEKAPGPEAPA